MNLFSAYQFFFYKIYRFYDKNFENDEMPILSALLIITLMLFVNFVCVLMTIEFIFKVPIIYFLEFHKLFSIGIFFLIFVCNYIFLGRKS